MTQSIEKLTKEERTTAQELLKRVDELLAETKNTHDKLLRDHAEIGELLLRVQESKAWLITEHKTFDQWVMSCEEKFGRKRTALYGYKSVAKRLLPSVDRDALIEMGISKAQSLANIVRKTNKPPSDELLRQAKNPQIGVEEFRAIVAEEVNDKPDKGTWFDLAGFFCTPEERKEIESAFAAAKTQIQVPEGASEWLERKLILQAMCMECLSSWGATV